MSPTYLENESVIVSSIPYFFIKPKKRDIVVFKRNTKFYIKRIKDINENKYFLTGDNKIDSLDSRKLGFINREQIKGKVIYKL